MSEHSAKKEIKITPPVPVSYVDSLWVSYVVSVLAAWVAEFVTYPLDITKTRLQVQGELANKQDLKLMSAPHRGMVNTLIGIVREEGLPKLWHGMSAGLARHVIYSGTRMVTYQVLRDEVFQKKLDDNFPMWKSAFCGVTAGAFAQYIANPADLLKVHLQMEGRRRLMGLPPRVHGFHDAFSKVIQTSGYKGLWKGAVPNVYRAAFINLGDLSTYDYAKRVILMKTSLEDNYLVHIIASFIAEFVAAAVGTPADVIKTRVMNQPVDKDGRPLVYKSTLDCAVKSIKNEGLLSLYKGFWPLFLRLAPWSISFWMSYELILHAVGGRGCSYSEWDLPCGYFITIKLCFPQNLVTYPLDLTKTRLQIQGELANKADNKKINPTAYRGMLKTACGIAKEEGLTKLWQGMSAGLLRHVVYSGTRMVAFQFLRDDVFKKKPDEHFALWKSAFCGISAGAFAQYIASPTDLLKVQLQMEGKRKMMGLPPRVNGLSDAFKKVWNVSGFKGLWKGSIPNVQRAALVNLGDLTTYDYAKRFILMNTSLKDNHFVHVVSSFCAGFMAATMGTPADVIKTRVMNQPLDKDGRGLLYKSSIDCLIKTTKGEGFSALYKGFFPIWLRMAPWSLTFWLSYEEVMFTIRTNNL